ncbi:hypothetical protein LMIY3S_02093 [Labrys miyagiensis]
MRRRAAGFFIIALMSVAVLPEAARSDGGLPDAASLLFDEPQLAAAPVGEVLTYDYHRKTSNDTLYGPSFEDKIKLTIDKGATEGTRTVDVVLFSGTHRQPAGPFEDMSGNPILSLFLEHHIEVLSQLYHANPRYLKNAIRAALREKANVDKADVPVGGKSVAGWRVRISPFKDDPNKARMNGLDTMTYQFLVAKGVPGEIADIRVTAVGSSATLLDEGVSYETKSD